jgi:hypothetical protein
MGWDADLNIGYAINNFSGYIQAFRVTLGQSRYNMNFTVPTLPLAKD